MRFLALQGSTMESGSPATSAATSWFFTRIVTGRRLAASELSRTLFAESTASKREAGHEIFCRLGGGLMPNVFQNSRRASRRSTWVWAFLLGTTALVGLGHPAKAQVKEWTGGAGVLWSANGSWTPNGEPT